MSRLARLSQPISAKIVEAAHCAAFVLLQRGLGTIERRARQLRHHKVGPAGVLGTVHRARRGQRKPALQVTEHRAFELEVVAQEGRVELDHQFAAQQRYQHRALAGRHRWRPGVAVAQRGDHADPAPRVFL